MKYCAKCGKELSDAARCCSVCGGAPTDTPPAHPVQPAQSAKPVTAFSGDSVSGIWKLFLPANLLGILGCVIVLFSVFLTFVSVSLWGFSRSVSLMDGDDGMIFLVAAVIGAVLCFIGKPVVQIVSLVYSCLLAIMALYETSNMDSALGDMGSYSSMVQRGAGYYLLIIGALVYLLSAVCVMIARKRLQ